MISATRRPIRDAFVIGLALTTALAGVGYAAFTGLGVPYVPYAIAETLRDLAPGPVRSMTMESTALIAKMLIVTISAGLFILAGALLAAAYSAVRNRIPRVDWLGGLLLGLVAFLISVPIVMTHRWAPTDSLTSTIAFLGLYLLWGLAVDQSIRAAAARPDLPPEAEETVVSRRTFLVQTAAGGVLVEIFGGLIGKLVESNLFAINFASVPRATPDVDGFLAVRGTWPEITLNDSFYTSDITMGSTPKLSAESWRLKIDGLVDKPMTYTLADVMKLEQVPPFAGTLMNITNPVGGPLVGTAIWEGVRLSDVLKAAAPTAAAKEVIFRSADGYSTSLPLDAALDANTYLVHHMNGVSLPVEHGYPLRLYVPTRYGLKSPKWITSITLSDTPYQGYWEQQGWSQDAIVKHNVALNTLDSTDRIPLLNETTAMIGGVANGGGRGISKVEYRIDDGTWHEARLKKPLSPFAWVLWRAQFPAKKDGKYKIQVRATDGTGTLQAETVADSYPDGVTGLDSRTVTAFQDLPPTTNPALAPTPSASLKS